jgi:CubicO group peptidase (beta-lactamase class C family)
MGATVDGCKSSSARKRASAAAILPLAGPRILSPKIDLPRSTETAPCCKGRPTNTLRREAQRSRFRSATKFAFHAALLAAFSMTVFQPRIASAAEDVAALRANVEQALPKSIGACVLAIDAGEVILNEGFGRTDVKSGEPCTPATNFRMASVSKQFTATAVLMLVDQGKLSLDDTLDKFFPGGPKYWEKITVKHLLTHTSGIPDYEELIPEGTTLQLDDLDVVQMLMETKEPLFAPDEKWQYSNSAFVLLGMIVEVAAKKPFQQFMADEVFTPLKMDDTVVFQRGLNEVKRRAFGYQWNAEKEAWIRADQSVTSATRGDGCVYTSLDDYRKWLRGHLEHKLLSEKSHLAMFSPQVKTDRGENHYGYGWFIDRYKGELRIHHNGDSRGFRICSQIYPDRLAAVVLQFNSEVDEDMTKVGERIADILIFDREDD